MIENIVVDKSSLSSVDLHCDRRNLHFSKANDSSLFYICILISLNELGLKMYTVRQLRNLENVNYHKMSNGEVQSDI